MSLPRGRRRTAAWLLLVATAAGLFGCGQSAGTRSGAPAAPRVEESAEPGSPGRSEESGQGAAARPEAGALGAPTAPADQAPELSPPADRAPETAAPPLVTIDTHIDTTQRMLDGPDDLAEELSGGHVDLPRMRRGGLTGAFFSIWVDPRRFRGDAAHERALALIGAVERLGREHPDEAVICRTADEVRAAASAGRAALLMGVEGGNALGTDDPELALERLREFYARGVRYMTITWAKDNVLGHSSGGNHRSRGLTPLGRSVVAEMNRLGMIVDVSHASDRTFWDIMEITERPVLASHSSVRSLSNHPRNLSDRMIRRIAEGGGAVCINYYSQFIDIAYRDRRRALIEANPEPFAALAEQYEDFSARGRAETELAVRLDPDIRPPDMSVLGNHFQRVVEVGGPSAACLGSDFDGISELPVGFRDVGDLGSLRAELERRGLPIRPILGDNVLRVLAAQSSP